ncbi:MAG: DNA mismatch repair protein MutS [SAR324 cluster bacterium]|nr:DNA mismatch repair protein MutS [SAR324 cluster bacterium]MBL7034932.1 DNA mismatch repair protein MutS [SAR324 cluster bacterium]
MSVPQAETPMMRQFNAIKRNHPDKLLFYRMGDFYEMFGDDAIVGAKVLQIALTSRDKKSKNSLPMCGVPFRAYEQYLNKLTAAGYKVAICEQMEDPAKAQGLVTRDVVRVVTPGTTVSPQLIDPDSNHYLLAINVVLRSQSLGIAFADLSTGEFEVAEFDLKETHRFYDFLSQLTPQEILLTQSRSESESRFLEELVQRMTQLLGKESDRDIGAVNQIKHDTKPQNGSVFLSTGLFNFIDPYHFDPDATQRNLKKHFETLNLSGFGVDDLPHGISAAGALLRYLEETQKCDLSHLTALRRHSFENTMLLDEATVANLELFESQSGIKKNTLFHILNHTRTPMGARLFRQWLRQPLLDAEAIDERLDCIEEFRNNFMLCEEFRECLDSIQDLPRIMGRINLPVAGVNDLVALRESLVPLQILPTYLAELQSSLLKNIAENFDPLENLLNLLNQRLLEVPSVKLREGGFIAAGVSAELDELRDISRNSKQFLNEMLLNERENTGISSLKINFNKVFGYYLEVSNVHKSTVPEHYIRKQTLVNAERYITAELKEFEEKILTAEERIGELEYELFQQLKTEINSNTRRVQQTARDIAVADTVAGLAYVAEHNHYVRPILQPLEAPRKISLEDCRHPVIEQIDLGETFVPNDLNLAEAKCRIMLITGPNMAGKSTYMRQVALNVLMAQCGSYVAAGNMELTVVDRIFTRVGASDNLTLGQSTFMLEMNEAAAILNNATERSLIILDEIGRGTSTFDGISIAWAIVEYLQKLSALTLCATHYHELTALAQDLEAVENYSVRVEEEGEQIVFLRKIVSGEADKSYGVQVARLAGLPKSVVKRALCVMEQLEESSMVHHLPVLKEEMQEKKESSTNASDASEVWDSSETADLQLSLFPEESIFLDELKQLNLNEMTPLRALNYLHELTDKLRR